jgi:hypothetical protein
MKLKVIGLKETLFHFPVPKTDEFKVVPHSEFKKNYTQRMNEYNATIQGNVKNVFKQYASNLHPMYDALTAAQKPKIVMESAIFRQNSPEDLTKVYYRFAWNHFMRKIGEFNNVNSPPDRWLRLQQEQKIEIKDWRNTGGHILVILQKQYDSSLVGLYEKHKKYAAWLKGVLEEIRKHTDRKIIIRDHPRMKFDGVEAAVGSLKNIERSKNNKSVNNSTAGHHLLKDFEDAWAVVGYTSSTLVDSVCEGIPTFALSEYAMAYDVCNHNLSQIETPSRNIDRQQWLNDMAYSQWSYSEIKKGEPWERIKPIYFK